MTKYQIVYLLYLQYKNVVFTREESCKPTTVCTRYTVRQYSMYCVYPKVNELLKRSQISTLVSDCVFTAGNVICWGRQLLASLVPTRFCTKFSSGPVYSSCINVFFQKPQYKTDQKIQNNGRRGFTQNNLKRPLEYQSNSQLQQLKGEKM